MSKNQDAIADSIFADAVRSFAGMTIGQAIASERERCAKVCESLGFFEAAAAIRREPKS